LQPRSRHERARQLADYFAAEPEDGGPMEIIAQEIAAQACERSNVFPPKKPA
jgi:hypothetical protein